MNTQSTNYRNFDLYIAKKPDGYQVRVSSAAMGSPVEESATPFPESTLDAVLQEFLAAHHHANVGEATLVKVGSHLFDALFQGEIRTGLWRNVDDAERNGANLRIRLHLDDFPELARFPWEYLFDAKRERFLSLSPQTAIVHMLALPDPSLSPAVDGPLRLLAVIASPLDLPPLNVEQEWLNLQAALQNLIQLGRVQLDRLDAPTVTSLQQHLRANEYHVLHFVGHGEFDERLKQGQLFFVNRHQKAHAVTAKQLGILLHNSRTVRLVTLNSCEGARTASFNLFAGIAQSLIQNAIPAVIAMQYELTDDAAATFSNEFYRALASGRPIEAALTDARVLLYANGIHEWGTPRLYLNANDGQLWQMSSAEQEKLERQRGETQTLQPPRPFADPSTFDELDAPGGAVRLNSTFYVERGHVDERLYQEIVKTRGTTTTIRGPRQVGKTSLLIRANKKANEAGHHTIYFDLQEFGGDQISSLDVFLHNLAIIMVDELSLDLAQVATIWGTPFGASRKMYNLLEKYILPTIESPFVLVMDEVDRLLETSFHDDFFGLVRAWHNRRARNELWEKLHIVMVISTEPHLLIQNTAQSPFNVGLRLELVDFDSAQVHYLDEQYKAGLCPQYSDPLLDLLGGHPYLTQQALYTCVTEELTWSALDQIAATDTGPFADHLSHYLELLYKQPALAAAMKDIINRQTHPDTSLLRHLLRAGLIKRSQQGYVCRCGLYHRYFESRL